jgi:hypothetical protein
VVRHLVLVVVEEEEDLLVGLFKRINKKMMKK